MKRFIVPAGALVCVVFAVMLLVSFEYIALDVVQIYTKVSDVRCGFVSWSDDQNYLRMNLSCGPKAEQKTLSNTDVIIAYLKNPSDFLSCTTWMSGQVTCENPKPVERKK